MTAAHEMLHAAHHQLASRKLAKLEPLLEWTYGATTDPKLHEEVDSYPKSQRLDEIYDAVAQRLHRELLLSRERNGSLL